MQLSAEQQYALSQIGIPLWVRRNEQAQPATSADPEPVGLPAVDFSKSWAVVVEKPLTVTELRLLRAILRSVDISYDSIAIVEKASATALSLFDKQQTVGLVLGNRIAQALDLQQDEQTGGQRLHGHAGRAGFTTTACRTRKESRNVANLIAVATLKGQLG